MAFKIILFLILFSCCPISSANAALSTSEAVAAAETFRSTFGVPYHAAINFLTYSVLKPLADAPVPETSAAADPLVTAFSTNINQFIEKLKPLSESSQTFRQTLDRLMETITVEHSRVEVLLTNLTTEIAQVSQHVTSTQSQLTIAQREVDAANERLAGADRVLQDAENRLNKGEKCIIRKKRGWLKKKFKQITHAVSSVAKATEDVVIRDIPHAVRDVVNSACRIFINVGNLKRDRNTADDQKNAAVTNLHNVQQNYNGFVAARDRLVQQRRGLFGRKDDLGVTLQQLNDEKVKAVAINVKIKQVIVYVSSLMDRGTTLRDVASKLIDMEALVLPLNAVSELVLGFISDPADALKLSSLKAVIGESAKTLQVKLPLYPLILLNLKPK